MENCTGAAQNTFFVKAAAAAQGSSATTSARSGLDAFLRNPAWTPDALNPLAEETPPSGRKANPCPSACESLTMLMAAAYTGSPTEASPAASGRPNTTFAH